MEPSAFLQILWPMILVSSCRNNNKPPDTWRFPGSCPQFPSRMPGLSALGVGVLPQEVLGTGLCHQEKLISLLQNSKQMRCSDFQLQTAAVPLSTLYMQPWALKIKF